MKIRIFFTIIILFFLISCQNDSGRDLVRFYIGTYAEESDDGILSCQLNTKNSTIEIISRNKGIKNPSFLAMDPKGEFLYAVSEVNDYGSSLVGGVFSFRIDPGAGPRHMAFSADERQVYVINELNSTISTCNIDQETGVEIEVSKPVCILFL